MNQSPCGTTERNYDSESRSESHCNFKHKSNPNLCDSFNPQMDKKNVVFSAASLHVCLKRRHAAAENTSEPRLYNRRRRRRCGIKTSGSEQPRKKKGGGGEKKRTNFRRALLFIAAISRILRRPSLDLQNQRRVLLSGRRPVGSFCVTK